MKVSSSWFKEPISEVIRPIVEGVQSIDGRKSQLTDNRVMSWFKEPISEAVGPFVEGVQPIDGRAGQPTDNIAWAFKRAQDLPSSLAHESLLGPIQPNAKEIEGCKAQPSSLLKSRDPFCSKWGGVSC